MKYANVSLTDKHGKLIWRGSLRQFLRANDHGREVARLLVRSWRLRKDDPITFGGGAAPEFFLRLDPIA